MKRFSFAILALSFLAFGSATFAADDYHVGRFRQPLLPRDSWGILHTTPTLNETDFASRDSWRLHYYFKSRRDLVKDPAYMGAVQEALQRNGFYCGPIDGTMSEDVSDAIARLQKAYGYSVNGALTVSVRRALYLP